MPKPLARQKLDFSTVIRLTKDMENRIKLIAGKEKLSLNSAFISLLELGLLHRDYTTRDLKTGDEDINSMLATMLMQLGKIEAKVAKIDAIETHVENLWDAMNQLRVDALSSPKSAKQARIVGKPQGAKEFA